MFAACLRQRPGRPTPAGNGRDQPGGESILRRQTRIGGLAPAGSSRDERLDPFTLPMRFAVSDKAADERRPLRRALARARRASAAPCAASRWRSTCRSRPISASRSAWSRPKPADAGAVAIVLEHRDPGLSLPLYRADDGTDIVAEWQSWARVLGMPLLVAEADGRSARAVRPHRRGPRRLARSLAAAAAFAIQKRRPSLRCGAGRAARSAAPAVHRGRARDHRAQLGLRSRHAGAASGCRASATAPLPRSARSAWCRGSPTTLAGACSTATTSCNRNSAMCTRRRRIIR